MQGASHPTFLPLANPRGASQRFLTGIALAATCAGTAPAAILYVSPCGNNGWAGVSPSCIAPLGPKRTIQAALAAANDGDEVRVLPGVYVGQVDLDGKAVHLVGLSGAGATFIDGAGAGPVVLCNSLEGPDTVIEGFTITGGQTNGDGAGITIGLSNPTIVDCTISGNEAGDDGGGVAIVLGSPSFIDCLFSQNQAGGSGGGVFAHLASPSFTGCTFELNTAADEGGGIAAVGGAIDLTDVELALNDADYGGGLSAIDGAVVSMVGCDVVDNAAVLSSGGLSFVDASVSLFGGVVALNTGGSVGGLGATRGALQAFGVTFSGNACSWMCGAVGLAETSPADTSFELCGFFDNLGGLAGGAVVVFDGGMSIEASTMFGNGAMSGGAIASWTEDGGTVIRLRGTVLSGNTATIGGGAVYLEDDSDFVATHCEFVDNETTAPGGNGGAIVAYHSFVALSGCDLIGNSSFDGGAMLVHEGTLMSTNTIFAENSATDDGGALYLSYLDAGEIANCTIAANSADDLGGAIFAWDSAAVAITNSIVWSNGASSVAGNNLPTAQYSIAPAAIAGAGCFFANPDFVSGATGDYRLKPWSPAIDAGLSWLLPFDIGDADNDGIQGELVQVDHDGFARTASAALDGGNCSLVLDLGAHELGAPAGAGGAIIPGDLDGDGVVGAADLGLLLAAWGDVEDCPAADLNGDGVVNGADLAVVLAGWM